ncbi:MAG: DUF2752 domain-containing protein [Mucilaginibacter sp.]
MIKTIFFRYFELCFWIAALVSLALADPASQSHFSLCPLKMLGITWCPGCGLGHAISFLLHGVIQASFHAHWLGIPALLGILHRIYVLARMRLLAPGNPFAARVKGFE